MSRETFTYDDLNVGEYEVMAVTVASGQTIKRGDLLIADGDNRETQAFSARGDKRELTLVKIKGMYLAFVTHKYCRGKALSAGS